LGADAHACEQAGYSRGGEKARGVDIELEVITEHLKEDKSLAFAGLCQDWTQRLEASAIQK
jgi:hypothetical protein